VHDITDLERRGVPGVFVASVEFDLAAKVQSSALGFAAPYVLVDHPIQDRTDDEMRIIAEKAVAELLEKLTSG